MEKCDICGKEVKNILGMSLHLRMHKINLKDYYIQYKGLEIPKCRWCEDHVEIRKGIIFNKTCGKEECISMQSRSLKHKPETIKLLSELQKKWLREHIDEHSWKKLNRKSPPCEHLKEKLRESGLTFYEEHMPIVINNYAIDIAFPYKKIGLEVNGNQHYKRKMLTKFDDYHEEKQLAPYYQERKEKIEKEGWILIDIHYSLVWKPKFVDNLIKQLKEQLKTRKDFNLDLDFSFEKEKEIKHCKKCGKELGIDNRKKMCPDCAAEERRVTERPPYKELMAEIDKYGYTETGRRHDGVSDNTIRNWVKMYRKNM